MMVALVKRSVEDNSYAYQSYYIIELMIQKLRLLYQKRDFQTLWHESQLFFKNNEGDEKSYREVAAMTATYHPDGAIYLFNKLSIKTALTTNDIFNLGVCYNQTNDKLKAIDCFERCLVSESLKNKAFINLLGCQVKVLEPSQWYQSAVDYIANGAFRFEAYVIVDDHYKKLDDLDARLDWIDKCFGYLSNNTQFQLRSLELKIESNHLLEAQELLNTITVNEADQIKLKQLHAVLLLKQGKLEQSIKIYQNNIAAEPSNPIAYYNLASVYSHHTSNKTLLKGLEVCNEGVQVNSQYAPLYHCRGILLQKLNRIEESAENFKQAIDINSSMDYYVSLANAYYFLKKYSLIIELFEQAYAKFQPNDVAELILAKCYIQLSNYNNALTKVNNSLKLNKNNQEAIAINNTLLNRHQVGIDYTEVIQQTMLSDELDFTNNNLALSRDITENIKLRYNPSGLAVRDGYLSEEISGSLISSIQWFKKCLLIKILQYCKNFHACDYSTIKNAIDSNNYELNIWATCTNKSGYIDTHIHDDSLLSGAYYVQLPTEIDSHSSAGYFQYGDLPSELKVDNYAFGPKSIMPEVGMLLIFPSWLYHKTRPLLSNNQRISLAFDFDLLKRSSQLNKDK